MILLTLFTEFFKIGMFSVGAYASIPLIQESIAKNGWLDNAMFANMLAISESTPGPIMVNTATYVGSLKGGLLGSVFATLGVVLPAFIVILLICIFFKNWNKNKIVRAVLLGVKPCVIGIIFATGANMLFESLRNCKGLDITSFLIFAILLVSIIFYHRRTKKFLSPIQLIILSAMLGVMLY